LRALAVLLVVVYHLNAAPSGHWWSRLYPRGGYIGVDIFFVLSGFLITTILLREWEKRRAISLRRFYARRALRLLPALAGVVLVTGTVAAILRNDPWSRPTLLGLPWVIGYVGNWNVILYGGSIPLGALGHTWSLAIEEQFYFLWPLILLVILHRCTDRLRVASVLFLVAFAEMVYRYVAVDAFHWAARDRVYFGSDTHSDGLLLGCGLAFLLVGLDADSNAYEGLKRAARLAAPISLIVIAVLSLRISDASTRAELVAVPATGLAATALITHLVTQPFRWLRAVLEWRPALWVGRRSYGLYLWHNAIFWMLTSVEAPQYPSLRFDVVRLALSFTAAALSYRYLEAPLLRLKSRFSQVEAQDVLNQRQQLQPLS
jgi:peptidoglycan/LPS O-acetylase OafA/YrhL